MSGIDPRRSAPEDTDNDGEVLERDGTQDEDEDYEDEGDYEDEPWQPAMTPRERWVKCSLLLLAGLIGGTLNWYRKIDGEVTEREIGGLQAGLLGWLLCCVIVVLVVRKGNRDDAARLKAERKKRDSAVGS